MTVRQFDELGWFAGRNSGWFLCLPTLTTQLLWQQPISLSAKMELTLTRDSSRQAHKPVRGCRVSFTTVRVDREPKGCEGLRRAAK